jgi:hypothetical protein
MERNKIIIYDNDLKFKHHTHIDLSSNLIEFASNDIKTKAFQILNTIEYRINEAAKDNFYMIDLSKLSLTNINDIFKQEHYENCEILFLNNNNLFGHIDFSKFVKLQILDIESNNIESFRLPKTIIELTANYNNIKTLQKDLHKLERLLINNNKLIMIEEYLNLELLDCANNNIEIIKYYPKIRKIIAFKNPLKSIEQNPSLLYLDIAETPINYIPIFPNLKHLVASNTKLTELNPLMINLEFIEIIDTPIKRFSYFENFDIIILSSTFTKKISSKYNLITNSIITTKGKIITISKNLSK